MGASNRQRQGRPRTPMRHVYPVRRITVACAAIAMVAMVAASTMGAGRALAGRSAPAPATVAAPAVTGGTASPAPSASPAESSASPSESAEQAAARKALEAQGAALDDAQRASIMDAAVATARQAAQDAGTVPMKMTYCIASKGDVGSLDAFANTAYRTLNATDGWPRAGVVFEQVQDGCDVTLTLSAPQDVPGFSSMCSAEYSCRVGSDVIINKTRWDEGVADWLVQGRTLADYRTMVINHEVGHALGHTDNEQTCAGEGQSAPLMQEQSMFLDGCAPNSVPLDSELWTAFQGTAI